MHQLRRLCSLKIVHEWYAETLVPLELVFTGDSAKLAQRSQLGIKLINGVYEIYWTGGHPEDVNLDIEICTTDPWLFAHTDINYSSDVGKDRVEQKTSVFADVLLNADKPTRKVTRSDWKQNDRPGGPLARTRLACTAGETPLLFELHFPAISTYWTYVINSPNVPDKLAITTKDGSESFVEIGSSPSSHGSTPRRFRSLEAIPSLRQNSTWFELVSSANGGGALISPLPTPTANVLPRPISDSGKFESQIFVTVFAKGAP